MKKNKEILEKSMQELGILIKTTKEVIDEIVSPLMPMSLEKVIGLSARKRTSVDSLSIRYVRIQDMLSNKIFILFLKVVGEQVLKQLNSGLKILYE